ncbi:intradiol ring-cleavage dioxygenase [Paraburkholderia humisilvae]|uniref:Hydroxyquinol 1,2-dioxygenase n=1 Tax=Paraburkholderia humisilvae TaxID=627669 RepID=A0A6J5EVP0_9BURK|nr:intradiol ring-cleavage dioxygenase [Paraburkholderia humisilvae]CAB3770064.1 Hydroxyquinol 1,2-dioxygenase [Paraburkholderia humisilvae]
MRNLDEHTITDAVLARHERAGSARLKEIAGSLIRHLHEFAREVNLTEGEWEQGIRFLTEVGHATNDKRQEFILLSDTLGLSMLVVAMANRKPAGCTEATVFGPFFVEDAPESGNGADLANGASGVPCFVSGNIKGPGGEPVHHARIDVWQADGEGRYDVQYSDDGEHRARGTLYSRSDGSHNFRSIVGEPYTIPYDGPVGRMLDALGRHAWRPAHLHFMITAPGYERLITQVFREGDPYLDSDAVFGVRSSLIAPWVPHDAGVAPDGSRINTPFCTLNFDFVLNRAS